MSKGLGFSISDIQSARKALNHDERSETKDTDNFGSKTSRQDKEYLAEIEGLKEVYRNFNGDIRQIFEKFQCNPRKALKHPPKDEDEFATKFYQGFYTVVEEEDNSSEGKYHK